MRRDNVNALTAAVIAACSMMWLGGCGKEVEFTDGTATAPPLDAVPKEQRFTSVTWWWPCEGSGTEAPAPDTDKDVVLVGAGPHALPLTKLIGVPFTFKGQLCAPKTLKRDIVFVVDVSGSMGGGLFVPPNDPVKNNSCGRLRAVQAVAESLSGRSDVRYSVVTFSDRVYAQSTGFFSSVDEMFGDLLATTGENKIHKVLCAAKDATNYNLAMSGAATLLAGSADDAQKEVYFISDGQPEPAENNGIAEANAIKMAGATIATLMLKGDDTVMESDIASRDSSGIPLHAKVMDAGDLVRALQELSINGVEGGQWRYRVIGGSAWDTADVMEFVSEDLTFSLPPFKLGINTAPQGIETMHEYWDRRGNHYAGQGRLTWSAGD